MNIPEKDVSLVRRALLKRGPLASLAAGMSIASSSGRVQANETKDSAGKTAREVRGGNDTASGRFDVHAHYVPPAVAQLKPAGGNFAAPPMPQWSPDIALDFMDRHGIATQMLSIPVALPSTAARAANTYGAQVVKQHPQRFGLLAALPMGDIEATLAEIDYAFDVLGADGAIMMTNYAGAYLGNPKYEPVFAALDRRHVTVFVHPADAACLECVALGRPAPVIEFPFDTCRTVTDMVYANVIKRFSSINFILAHAGGALPGLAHRIASLGVVPFVPHPPEMTPQTTLSQLSQLYFDTAIAGSVSSIQPVLQLTSADHIVFGSDFPPATERVIRENIEALDGLTCLSHEARDAISQNGRRLFARFTAAGKAT
jgi:predicted TIM-barrel fold metal-dependent hydrolase